MSQTRNSMNEQWDINIFIDYGYSCPYSISYIGQGLDFVYPNVINF